MRDGEDELVTLLKGGGRHFCRYVVFTIIISYVEDWLCDEEGGIGFSPMRPNGVSRRLVAILWWCGTSIIGVA